MLLRLPPTQAHLFSGVSFPAALPPLHPTQASFPLKLGSRVLSLPRVEPHELGRVWLAGARAPWHLEGKFKASLPRRVLGGAGAALIFQQEQ